MEAATVIKPQHEGTRKHLLFTDEHEDLRESMEAWVKKELWPHRNEWEEIPTSLVDLKRTQKEAAAREADLDRRAREFDAEDLRRMNERKDSRAPSVPSDGYTADPSRFDAVPADSAARLDNPPF